MCRRRQPLTGKDQPADLFGDAGIFTRVSNIMLFLVGAIAVIMIIFGGIRYVVSGGNSSQVQGAKNTIMYAPRWCRGGSALAHAAVNFVINTIIPGGNINTTTNSSNTGASTTLASNTWLSSHINICAHHRGVRFRCS